MWIKVWYLLLAGIVAVQIWMYFHDRLVKRRNVKRAVVMKEPSPGVKQMVFLLAVSRNIGDAGYEISLTDYGSSKEFTIRVSTARQVVAVSCQLLEELRSQKLDPELWGAETIAEE